MVLVSKIVDIKPGKRYMDLGCKGPVTRVTRGCFGCSGAVQNGQCDLGYSDWLPACYVYPITAAQTHTHRTQRVGASGSAVYNSREQTRPSVADTVMIRDLSVNGVWEG